MNTKAIFLPFLFLASFAGCSGDKQAQAELPVTAAGSAQVDHSEHGEDHEAGQHVDQRQTLQLSQIEQLHVRNEMHDLLGATQGVIKALALGDMVAVAEAAKPGGMKAPGTVDMRLGPKLPKTFRTLGKSTHMAFDEIGAMAARGDEAKDIQLYLAQTMDSCAACHSTYRLGKDE